MNECPTCGQRIARKQPTAECVTLYKAYPRHVAPLAAYKAIAKALQTKPFDELLLAVTRFAKECQREATEPRFIPHPASWFNAGRYDDEPTATVARNSNSTNFDGVQLDPSMVEFYRQKGAM